MQCSVHSWYLSNEGCLVPYPRKSIIYMGVASLVATQWPKTPRRKSVREDGTGSWEEEHVAVSDKVQTQRYVCHNEQVLCIITHYA